MYHHEYRPEPPEPLGQDPPPSGSRLAETGILCLLAAAVLFILSGHAGSKLAIAGLLAASAIALVWGIAALWLSFTTRP